MNLESIKNDPELKARFVDCTSLIANICFNAWVVAGEPDALVYIPIESIAPLMEDINKERADEELVALSIEHLISMQLLHTEGLHKTRVALSLPMCRQIAKK